MKKLKIIVTAMCIISCLTIGTFFNAGSGIDYVSGATSVSDETLNFDYVKKNGEVQTFMSSKGGSFKVYTATLSVDPANKVKKVALYGKLDFPLTSTEFGAEEFENKLYLTKEESFIKYNGGIKSFLIWSDEDTNSKYDKQIFMHDGVMQVRGTSMTLTLGEEEFEINVPDKGKKADTTYLEDAINEHWNSYNAVKNSGLKLTIDSEEAYISKDHEARELVKEANRYDSEVTDENLESMRKELNEKFGDLMPMPYEKGELAKTVKIAKERLEQNGKNGKRFIKEKYDALVTSYINATTLLDLEDLKSIVTSIEGEPIKTHRDFDNAKADLEEKISNLIEENYSPVDLEDLKKVYMDSVAIKPKEGYGFSSDSRKNYYDTLEEVRNTLIAENIYLTDNDIIELKKKIEEKKNALVEEKLDPNKKVRISIKYTRPMSNAISHLLKEYFKNEDGEPITEVKEVTLGEEVIIPINSDIVKKFDGYRPISFHYNSDDGTLKLVRVFTDVKGKTFAVFKATSSNDDNLATLDIYYEEGKLPEEAIDDSKSVEKRALGKEGVLLRGMLSEDSKLNVESIDYNTLSNDIKKEINKITNGRVIGSYDISLTGKHEGDLELEFTLDKKYKNITIIHIKGDMTVEKFDKIVENGKVIISVDSLSPFIIIENNPLIADNNSNSNDITRINNAHKTHNSKGDISFKSKSPKTDDFRYVAELCILMLLSLASFVTVIKRMLKI